MSNSASAPGKTDDEEAQEQAVNSPPPNATGSRFAMSKKKWWAFGIAMTLLVIFVIGLSVGLAKKNNSDDDGPPLPNYDDDTCDYGGAWCSSNSDCCSGICYNNGYGYQFCYGM